ncbi:MAG: hypothetical protein Tsb005_11450 [Gammaproteobacteria bacterium]
MLKIQSQKNFFILGILAIIFIAPVLMAIVFYHYRIPQNTINHGALLKPPVAFTDMRLASSNTVDSEVDLHPFKQHWIMFYVHQAATCQERCVQNLYKMRQIRLATGQDQLAIINILGNLSSDLDTNFQQLMKRSYPNIHYLHIVQLPPRITPNHLYVIDPYGNIILQYAADADPKHILHDFKRLLKVAQ